MSKNLISRLGEEFNIINLDDSNNYLIVKSPFDRTLIKVKILIENINRVKVDLFKNDDTPVQTIIIEDIPRDGYAGLKTIDYCNCITYAISSYFVKIFSGITILDIHVS